MSCDNDLVVSMGVFGGFSRQVFVVGACTPELSEERPCFTSILSVERIAVDGKGL